MNITRKLHLGRFTTLAAAAALLTACAQNGLVPAPHAQLVPGQELAAIAENAGVRMVVESGAWSARPHNLTDEMTPLKVTIQNTSDQPVRVSYADFAIETGKGIRYTPLPPLRIEGTVTQTASTPVYVPRFTHSGFFLAPWYGRHYAGIRPWPHPWAFSRAYYDRYYPQWTVQLPTQDMLERAIPEGVLAPGGSLSGFLYFPEMADNVNRVTFKAELMQGQDGQRIGALEVPFQMR